jgi:predicted metal-dependent HD superfamily phosphohydrolase
MRNAEETYFKLMEERGLGNDLDDQWAKIERAYTAPNRHYHNLQHVEHVLARCDELIPLSGIISQFYIDAIYLAVIYHDVVYVPGASYNELGSAALASLDISGGSPPTNETTSLITSVMSLIRATTHKNLESYPTRPTKILLDADLYELSTDKYFENSKNIRKEFDCTDEEWYIGRTAWLEEFLERPFIYHYGDNQHIRAKLDLLARHNMVTELQDLAADFLLRMDAV